MTQLAEVVTLYETNARSIPDMLRQAADCIESEEEGDCSPTVAVVAVQLTADGSIQVYGWGDTTDIHAMGVLHCGLQQIGGIVLDTGE
jgi:hypothetical protein